MWLKIFPENVRYIWFKHIHSTTHKHRNLQNPFSTYYYADGNFESSSWSWIKIVLSSQVLGSSSNKNVLSASTGHIHIIMMSYHLENGHLKGLIH